MKAYRITWTAGGGAPRQDLWLPSDAMLVRRLRNYSSAMPLSHEDLSALRSWAAEHAPGHLIEIGVLEDLGARVAVPLLSKSDIVGVLLLGPPLSRPEYT